MGHTRLRTALVGLLVCVPSLALAAWPALGRQADDVRRTVLSGSTPSHHAHDAVWTGGVTISGKVRVPLSPGVTAPVTIKFDNPTSRAVGMQRVRVRIESISAPHADATHRCTRLDFRIHQMPRIDLIIPAARVTDLAGLGLPVSSWPTLAMRNLPHNQDGCKGATLTLRFRAARLDRR